MRFIFLALALSTVKDIAMDKIVIGPSQARVRQIDEDSACAAEACSS